MDAALLSLTIIGAIAAGVLVIVLLYFTSLIRRTNIVMKKVDYLVEELTYKAESLTVAVDAIRKLSNYVLAADSFTQKGFKSLFKFLSQNKNFFYGFIDKLRTGNNTKPEVKNETRVKNKPEIKNEPKVKNKPEVKKLVEIKDFASMTVAELKDEAKKKGKTVTSTMKKADLIKLVK